MPWNCTWRLSYRILCFNFLVMSMIDILEDPDQHIRNKERDLRSNSKREEDYMRKKQLAEADREEKELREHCRREDNEKAVLRGLKI